jgi:hypothetical protein
MKAESLRETLRAQPFHPFQIHLADGRAFDVEHPEFVAIPPKSPRVAILFHADGERFEIIDLGLVTTLSVRNDPGNGRRNGHSGDAP